MVRHLSSEARAGRAMPFVVEYQGRLVGQLTVGGIAWGSLRAAHVGYWVDREVAGRGIIPTAVALASDHCWSGLGLHRVEINIRPENTASCRVVEKLGFRVEGVRPRYLHIDGDWRDHITYALHSEEVPGGLRPSVGRLQAGGPLTPAPEVRVAGVTRDTPAGVHGGMAARSYRHSSWATHRSSAQATAVRGRRALCGDHRPVDLHPAAHVAAAP